MKETTIQYITIVSFMLISLAIINLAYCFIQTQISDGYIRESTTLKECLIDCQKPLFWNAPVNSKEYCYNSCKEHIDTMNNYNKAIK